MEMSAEKGDIYEKARKVLEDLLDLMDTPGSVKQSDEFTVVEADGSFSSLGLDIEGDDLGILIGRRGQTMTSLQQIVRIILSHQMELKIPVVIDVEGYKQRRCDNLRLMAQRLAEQVKTRKTPVTMEPMPAFERRVIHIELADNPDVYTESDGIGWNRKVIISPKTMLP
jgi:spoIIIJ-associated protein